jgi:hypothetical protein
MSRLHGTISEGRLYVDFNDLILFLGTECENDDPNGVKSTSTLAIRAALTKWAEGITEKV